MSVQFPWIRRRKKTEPDLPYEPPIYLGNKSNGEYYKAQTEHERKLRREIQDAVDAKARYVGMDRREFMASAMGMATSLTVINAVNGCGDSGGGEGSDGGYMIPDEATVDCNAAQEALGGDEFILDLQTHFIDSEEHWKETHPGQSYGGEGFFQQWRYFHAECGLDTNSECIGPGRYIEDIFLNSDTTAAVLSGFPSRICDDATLCNSLLSNEEMVAARKRINDVASSVRLAQHCQVQPPDQLDKQLEMMERIHDEYGNTGWKCYPPSGGWWLDGEEGIKFIEKALELGDPKICIHKGLPLAGFSRTHTDPKDVGVVAEMFPEGKFIVYHSALLHGGDEAFLQPDEPPYDPEGKVDPRNKETAYFSSNSLVAVVEEHGLKGKNVYAELGSAWFLTMNYSKSPQHLIGKLLKYIGEDNVLWGSECIWYASPQPQIEAFRTFQISEELQDKYGYPALTDEIKAKIFGLNAAKMFGFDPDAKRCTLDESKLAELRRNMDGELGGRRWAFQTINGPKTRREFMNLQRYLKATGQA